MRKPILYGLIWAFIFTGCADKSATVPAYITINKFDLETNYANQGSASSDISTVWVEANGEDIGVFELPVHFPLIANGPTEIVVYPGITLNGIQAYRNQYEFYKTFKRIYNISPEQEITLTTPGKTNPTTEYSSLADIDLLEDFEGIGLNFEKTIKSDTTLLTTSEPDKIFPTGDLNETNTKSGWVEMPEGNSLIEFKSRNSYILPTFGANVYLEVNYKCEVPVTFGVFANVPNQGSIQAPVVTVLPTDEWNKIYINLVTEVSAYPTADSYDIFFGAINTDASSTKTIYIDNLKLVY